MEQMQQSEEEIRLRESMRDDISHLISITKRCDFRRTATGLQDMSNWILALSTGTILVLVTRVDAIRPLPLWPVKALYIIALGTIGLSFLAVAIGNLGLHKRRVQFGMPISRYQNIQLRMAELTMRLETARISIYYLSDLLDKGEVDMFQFGAKSAAIKIYCTSSLTEMAEHCAFICAGDGYTNEFGIYSTLKNALLMQIAGGSNDILKLFVGRNEFIKDIDERYLPRVLRGITKEEVDKL